MIHGEVSEFGIILLFLIGGIFFVAFGLLTARLIRPKRPNIEKLTTYESGEDPLGTAWSQFNTRFYIIALVFILFEVELVFLFPWATVYADQELMELTGGKWGMIALVEMVAFVIILALGLVYLWVKGFLNWERPMPTR